MSGRIRYRHLFDRSLDVICGQRRKLKRLGWKASGNMYLVVFEGRKPKGWKHGSGWRQSMERADP